MSVSDMLGGIFSHKRMAKPAELSPYTIDHSSLDQFVHDELREQSKHFRNALDRCPELDIELDDGTTERKRIDAAAGLNSDMFFAFHDRRDVPRTMAPEKIRPSRELFRQVMDAMIDADDFKSARSRTRGDEVGSAFAMMAARDELDAALTDILKDDLQRAQDMEQHEDTLGGGPLPPLPDDPQERWEELQKYGQKRMEARAALDQLAQDQASSGMASNVQRAIESMAEAANDAADTWSNLPGNQPGQHLNMTPDEAIELAQKWMSSDRPREVAALMGRFQRDFRYKHTNRTVGGREVPVDVEFGNDLSKILVSEMMALAMPQTRALAMMRYVGGQMLQYEMVGSDDAGKGPFIMMTDFSGSMAGQREVWAKAVSLSMLAIAQRERRPVVLIAFDTEVLGCWRFEPRGSTDLNAAFEFASIDCNGGTEPLSAMQLCEEILTGVPTFRQADIVITTDGDCSFTQTDLDLKDRLVAMGVRIFGISIECRITSYLGVMCQHVIPVTDLANPSEATDMLVQTVI